MISQITNTQIQPKTLNKKISQNQNTSPNFKGGLLYGLGTQAFNFLNTSPAIGACFVDFASMVAPRSAVDFSRSKDAGIETSIREGSGTVNHALAGAVGLGAGYLVSAAFNKANGIKAHRVFMNQEALSAFKPFVEASATQTGYDSKKYWTEFLNNLEYLNTTESGDAWKKLSAKEGLVEKVVNIIVESNPKEYTLPKETMAKVLEEIVGETGAGSSYRLLNNKNVDGSIKDLTGNAQSLLKAVTDKATKDNKPLVENLEQFLKGIKNRKNATVFAGLAIPLAIGLSVQPLNAWFTKKRTGKDGFVGVEGREPDKSNKFKLIKSGVAFAMGSWMISTILDSYKELFSKKGLSKLLSRLQYKGMVPTLNQFKFIYGMTIFSRILACRDKNELRESAIKDTLGFANWLILGGFVSKLTAKALDRNIINYDKAKHGEGFFKFVTKAVEKTHEEILYPALKKLGISSIKDGKKLSFKTMMSQVKDVANNKAGNISAENVELAKKTLKQLKFKNRAQLAGYLYSGIVLGVLIPKLNIFITNKVEKKSKTANTDNQQDKMKVNTDFVQRLTQNENKTFSAFYGAM